MSLRRRPHQGKVSTRVISHAQQVRVSGHCDCRVHTSLTNFPVAAEYLAKGYALSDQILQRAIELDSACLPARLHPHDDRPPVVIPNREARNITALHELLPLDRFDPGAESSRARPDHFRKGPI